MAEGHQDDRGFTVKDRRRFSPETGEPRADGTDEAPEAAPAGGPAAGAGQSGAQAEAEGSGRPREHAAQVPEITLSTFILSMSTQALMHMGEIEGPEGEKAERDMVAAQQVIDILGMLRAKTKGNLEQNEEALFDHLLYDLRMRFVELSKTGSR
jgi:hypothetical protein